MYTWHAGRAPCAAAIIFWLVGMGFRFAFALYANSVVERAMPSSGSPRSRGSHQGANRDLAGS